MGSRRHVAKRDSFMGYPTVHGVFDLHAIRDTFHGVSEGPWGIEWPQVRHRPMSRCQPLSKAPVEHR